jgi:purine-nucleoside phosphorylase
LKNNSFAEILDMDKSVLNAADFLRNSGIEPQVFVVLGSGIDLSALSAKFADTIEIPNDLIPDMPRPTVAGHSGKIVFGEYCGVKVALLFGRKHIYEGNVADTLFSSKLFHSLGAETGIYTSAVGAVDYNLSPGDIVGLSGIIDLQGKRSVEYCGVSGFGSQDCPFDRKLTASIGECAIETCVPFVRNGVLASLSGPNYETPAEIVYLQKIGATVVGMSMAPEVGCACSLGIKCAGISLVTNYAGKPSEHAEVIAAARAASQKLVSIFEKLIPLIS